MKKFLKRDFCLWVVPPGSGKVRKFRLSFRFTLVVALIISFMALSYIYVSSDYSRIQLLRLQNFISLKRVEAERDFLASRNDEVEGELSALKDLSVEAQQRERAVRERMEELASVIRSVPALDDNQNMLAGKPQDGGRKAIGGAELDCIKKKGAACPVFGLQRFGMGGISFPALPQDNGPQAVDLVETLDHYVDLVKRLPAGTPSSARINSWFGLRRSPFSAGIRHHQGIDFDLDYGDPIISTADGVVSSVSWDRHYGLLVDISHNTRISTRYAHLSKALVTEGQRICRGHVLGLGGSSGRSTGPHLHYEVRVDGQAQNPLPFVRLAGQLNSLFDRG